MSGQQSPSPNPEQRQHTGHGHHQMSFQSGRDTRIGRGTNIVGGDAHFGDNVAGDKITFIQKTRQWALANPVLAGGLAVVLLSGSVWTGVSLASDDTVDVSVVNEPGLSGALHTAEQTRVAERVGDAAAWCHLVQPGDDACRSTMASAFAAKSQSYRDRVDEVGLGEPEKTGQGAQVMLRWKGRDQGLVRLVRSGGRWQLASSDYGWLKLCGVGVFLSLVDAKSQELKCGMFQLPTS
ncbi:hypothetical protein ABZ920_12115 [Streptomyces sp. NPDC046831]|uniref:hypothetical protein n=1 Tax=Streptomyces sp. NPDC046831 TaxID=3154805 RepID=UPI0033DAD2E7